MSTGSGTLTVYNKQVELPVRDGTDWNDVLLEQMQVEA